LVPLPSCPPLEGAGVTYSLRSTSNWREPPCRLKALLASPAVLVLERIEQILEASGAGEQASAAAATLEVLIDRTRANRSRTWPPGGSCRPVSQRARP
jgi:hypothetical protein